MLNRITDAEPRPGYRLWVWFADGVEGEVSLGHLVGKGVLGRVPFLSGTPVVLSAGS